MEDSLKKRYNVKLIASLLNGIIGIVIVAFVPKALGIISFGHFSYLQQSFTQVIAFLDAGTSTAFFTKLSARNDRKELIKFYLYFVLGVLIFLFSSLYLLDITSFITLLIPDISKEHIYLGMGFVFLTWFLQIYIKISDAYALTASVELIKIIHKSVMLLLLLYIIHFLTFNLSIYFYYHFFSLCTLLVILSFLFFKKDIFLKNILSVKVHYKKLSIEFFDYASPLFIFNTIAIGITLFDIWLLQYLSGSVQTGYYGLAYSIASMCFLFTSALTPIITREFAKSFEQKDMKYIIYLFKRYIPMLYAISAYFSVFIAFESDTLLKIFTDESFKDAYVVLVIMAFYPIHQTYGQLSGSLFLATGRTKLYRNIGLFVAMFGLIFSYLFLYVLEWGAIGFAWKMLLVQFISVNIQLYFNTKLLDIKINYFVKHQFYTLGLLIALGYISTMLVTFEDIYMNFIFSGIIYTIVVLMGFIVFPALFASDKEEVQQIVQKLQLKLGVKNV